MEPTHSSQDEPDPDKEARPPRSPLVLVGAAIVVVAVAVGAVYWLWVTGLAMGVGQLDQLTMSAEEYGGTGVAEATLDAEGAGQPAIADVTLDAGDAATALDAGPPETAEELLTRVLSRYADMPGLEAQISQTIIDPLVDDPTVNEGTLYFRAPGELRIDFVESTDPKARERVMLREGRFLWIYETHYHKAAKACFDTSWPTYALAFLFRPDRLDEEFAISAPEPYTLLLEPRAEGVDFERVRLSFDPESYELQTASLVDAYDIRTELEFTTAEFRRLPDDLFAVDAAGGFQVLNPRKRCP